MPDSQKLLRLLKVTTVALLIAAVDAEASGCDECRDQCNRVANFVYQNTQGDDEARESAAEAAYHACMAEFCTPA